MLSVFFFFQAEDGIRDLTVTGVQTCALPISGRSSSGTAAISRRAAPVPRYSRDCWPPAACIVRSRSNRSEEHTSELQSQSNLVCRLLLEKKKNKVYFNNYMTSVMLTMIFNII